MRTLRLILLVGIVFAGLAVGLSYQGTPAAGFSSQTTNPEFDSEVVVVRAFFDDPAMVPSVSAWKEPWEVNYEEGYLVVDVTEDEYNLLLLLGFRLEIDEKLTAEFNRPRTMLPGQVSGIPGYACYRTVEETFATAVDIVSNYPNLASWIDIGDSWEKTEPGGSPGYDMLVLRLTNANVPGPKPKLFAMTAVHAREYTTAELNTRFAEYLVENYGVDPDVTWLLDYHEMHLLLQSNPDGRKQAETGLSWRKNTNENYCSPTSSNRGADLNRNFEFQWGCCGGSSGSQCAETYRGPTPGSEPETQAIQSYVRSLYPDLRDDPIGAAAPITTTGIFLDIHSYSELVLWPWGFTSQPAGNATQLQTLGRKFAYFNGYEPEQAIGLYPTDGTTDDFAYGELGLPAYTFELGTSFFQDCGTFENTILPDNLQSLIYAAKAVRAPYVTPAGPEALNLAFDENVIAPGGVLTLTATVDDTRFNNQNGTEPTQNIVAAEFYIDTPPWITTTVPISIPMTAVDGSYNSPVEAAQGSFDTTGLPNGRHTVFVRGLDASGNWGPISAEFFFVLDPAVAPTIGGQVYAADTGLPLTATVSADALFQVVTDPATGLYQMQVLSGTYDVTAVPGSLTYGASTITDVVASDFQTIELDFGLYPQCVAFADDVESGNQGWTADFPWAITTESSNSPTHSWTDSPGGNYSGNRNVSMTSPVFDLSEYSNVSLNYWQICDTEADYDYCYVEASPDGGANWTTLASFDGNNSQWEEVSIPLSVLDNQAQARVRFRFFSDTFVVDDGWHVDDIQLTGAGPACVTVLAPQAGFNSSTPDLLGETTVFTNTSTGTDLNFQWDFGDSSGVLTDTHPTHVYTATGSYTVTLTVTNTVNSDVATGVVEILGAPEAGFLTSSPDGLGSATVFTNTTTSTGLMFAWDFGDGSPLSTEQDPSHVFGSIGLYTVTLTATNSLGADSATGLVEILEPAQASFLSSSPDSLGQTTVFTNTSLGTDLQFTWDFGDGSSIVTDTNPTHVYTATGAYTVSLTAANPVSLDNVEGVVVINLMLEDRIFIPMIRSALAPEP